MGGIGGGFFPAPNGETDRTILTPPIALFHGGWDPGRRSRGRHAGGAVCGGDFPPAQPAQPAWLLRHRLRRVGHLLLCISESSLRVAAFAPRLGRTIPDSRAVVGAGGCAGFDCVAADFVGNVCERWGEGEERLVCEAGMA